jgi:hypothetical protein
MSAVQPGCYYRCGRKAAVGRLFCSARCAAEWAEEMAMGNGDEWCVPCQDWKQREHETLACGHLIAGLTTGDKHADASAKYNAALEKHVLQEKASS